MNQGRLSRVLDNMKRYGLEQIVITSPEAIFYLLNIWVHPGERMLALYLNKKGYAKLFINKLFPLETDPGTDMCIYDDIDDPIEYLSESVDENKVMGVDKDWPSHFLIRLMKKKPGLKVEIGSAAVDTARMTKDAEEIKTMIKASEINDKAMEEILKVIKEGMTETEACKALVDIYLKNGAQSYSFEPLICYGKNTAEPHHSSDGTILKKNNCIILDIGCLYNDYCSDMTRSFYYGEPDDEYKKIYELVLKANLAGIAAVKPGVKLSDIDKAARKVIDDAGYGEYFTHRTGHNIGISVHEYPDVSSVSGVIAEEGMVFSIEPGIYLNGKYGVRIEDLVLVTRDGCKVLNKFSKGLSFLSK